MRKQFIAVAAALGTFTSAHAQTAAASDANSPASSGDGLEEIIVTATKRAESLQDVPLSISAVQGESIRERGLDTLEQVGNYMPNVRIAGIDGPAKFINIRGLGSGNNRGFETSVGLFLDGVYLGREVFLFDSYIDVARIEAIKGPQGANFGKNTIAGAISVVTADPSKDLSGELGLTVGENSKKVVDAVLSGPLSETLSGRLALQYYDRGGYVENTFLNRNDGARRVGAGRVKLIWEPTSTFSVEFTGQYADLKQTGTGRQLGVSVPCVTFASAARCAPVSISHPATAGGTRSLLDVARTVDPLAENKFNFQRSVGPLNDGENRGTVFTRLESNLDVGDHTLTYIGSYAEIINQQTLLDPDTTAFNGGLLDNTEDFNQQSHELRLTSPSTGFLTYIAGVYYFRSKVDGQQDFTTPLGVVRGLVSQVTKSTSLFGQATANLSDAFRAIGGLRHIDERKRANLGQTGIVALGFPTYTRAERIKDDKVLFNGALEYDLNDDAMLYASYSQGYKAGGLNFFDLRNNFPVFSSEGSDGYEVGLKSELFDRRVRFNVAAFLTDFSNLQVSTFNGTSLVVSNAASARSKGIEFDINWKVTENLLLNLSGAKLHARYRSYLTGACTIAQQLNTVGPCVQNLGGKVLERAPDESGVVNVQYKLPIEGKSYGISFSGDAIYSSAYETVNDLDPAGHQRNFWLFNGRIAVADNDDRWSIALVGKNIFNKPYIYSGNDVFQFAGSHGVLLGEARQIDAQFRYRW